MTSKSPDGIQTFLTEQLLHLKRKQMYNALPKYLKFEKRYWIEGESIVFERLKSSKLGQNSSSTVMGLPLINQIQILK